ncbi:YdeI family protein [Fluviicola sp.]|jgi:uncharacterized protein YdeI (YjbR/CyaY-like superfamily)|uniref:YdeI/OmpD-associated family protein n=1 Tax=Fluviicola sp. TaxID=1917219 RepID=UPI002617D79B|nr:YdeI/OmpD-associated family protein [Fluviicola sp.]
MSEVEIFYPENRNQWRKWLQENHDKAQSVWVVFYKKASSMPSLTWSEAVDEALCFGWIDSKKIAIDSEKSHQFFSRRRAKSIWSKINKEKVDRLIESGQMTPAGLACIEIAKENGSWNILDSVDALIIPEDLEKEFKTAPGAEEFFLNLSKSVRKQMLYWIISAKRPETRQKRIAEIVEHAIQKQKPPQF